MGKRRFMTRGLRAAFKKLEWEFKAARRHRRGVRLARGLAGKKHLRLHLGAGHNKKKDWINTSIDKIAEFPLDAREPLPFEDGSCTIVYSEHFLEHFDYPGPAMALLRECYRVLEPGGTFSAGVPDAEARLAQYAASPQDAGPQPELARPHADWCKTGMEHVNFLFRQDGEHRFAYDFLTLARALERAGFEEVRRREFDPELDSEDRRVGTLFVEAKKPTD